MEKFPFFISLMGISGDGFGLKYLKNVNNANPKHSLVCCYCVIRHRNVMCLCLVGDIRGNMLCLGCSELDFFNDYSKYTLF